LAADVKGAAMRRTQLHPWWVAGLCLTVLGVIVGCGSSGSLSNTKRAISADDTTSIAGPINPGRVQDVETIPRDRFARSSTVDALIFPSANGNERAHAARGLSIFQGRVPFGPHFNQKNCLGCHMAQLAPLPPNPASRARTQDAFLLFGDFNPATGEFRAREEAGGPVFHAQTVPGYDPQKIPPLPGAPFVRVYGRRAAPPYIGRGLMEAIPDSEILAGESPDVNQLGFRGFENRNSEAAAFIGGSPLIRLSRFGLRAAGPTLLQFMIGGTHQEIGVTSPFSPPPGANIPDRQPTPNPQPELNAQDIRDLRTLIRLIAPPAMAPIVAGSPEDRGRILFGADFNQPRGLAVDRRLNCAGCHTPIQTTGESPADVGARHLSNRRFFLFSDLLIHDMGQNLAQFRDDPNRPPAIGGSKLDAALPGQGRANPRTWRTPPLLGIGLIGPPHLHDARVLATQSPESALDQAIDLHDNNGMDADSEAHPSIAAYRALPPTGDFSQADLIAFLRAL
jgi:Di-haem oxidoreductase, putative peroxidase